jgi:hypothetical protein
VLFRDCLPMRAVAGTEGNTTTTITIMVVAAIL